MAPPKRSLCILYLDTAKYRRFNFSADYEKVVSWLKSLLEASKTKEQLELLNLLLKGFKLNEEERPTATDLFNQLQGIPPFVGECCAVPISGCGRAGRYSVICSEELGPKDPQLKVVRDHRLVQ